MRVLMVEGCDYILLLRSQLVLWRSVYGHVYYANLEVAA